MSPSTLFNGDWVELRTSCSVQVAPEQLSEAAWLDLLRACSKELLAPFEDVAAR